MKYLSIPLCVSLGAFIAAFFLFYIEKKYDHGLFTLGCAIYMRIIASDEKD